MQRKTSQPVPFELTERPRESTTVWIATAGLSLQVIEPLPEPQQWFQTTVDAAAGSYGCDWYVVGSRHSVQCETGAKFGAKGGGQLGIQKLMARWVFSTRAVGPVQAQIEGDLGPLGPDGRRRETLVGCEKNRRISAVASPLVVSYQLPFGPVE